MNRLAPDDSDARFLRRVLWLIVIVAVVAALYLAQHLLILAFGSILIAIVIHALADLYENHARLPKRPALIAAILSVLGFIALMVWLFGVEFRAQVNTLVVALPGLIDQLDDYLSQSPVGAKVVDAVRAAFAGSRVAQDIGQIVRGAGQLFLNSFIVLFGAIFFAVDPKVYERGFLLLIPPSKRAAVEDALGDVGSTLLLWLRAQLIQMTAMGTMVGIGLWIAGVPSAALLGLLTGISEFIPYVGPLAAMLPALGLAATAGTEPLLGALATFALVRIVQTNLVTPYVTGRVIAIPPALSLFAIIGTGAVFGVFGLFFSGGILVVTYTLVRSLYLREVLGEDIPPTRERRLFTAKGTPRDAPAKELKSDSGDDSPESLA
ncbi:MULTISPECIES: AI-2E family transporter [Sphingomonas]|uniref:AI-2E family transporter n=1 Tax=Sphingomonas adhaesiva TaxID=28212 RepID=A0A2A4I5R1_9SPHN|nr:MULTISPECIES: AI-2E family transporter [Sphingomonas]PCG13448.1 AI-2E family transporter [Sphingomonas adhaesiva]PZU77670.1 MAG: AI-2E family transporter [Sphingomonas sp.]